LTESSCRLCQGTENGLKVECRPADDDLVLTRFALERLLFRLSQSPHADRFVLKGAMLMMSWFDDPHRGTRDLDLLGFGDPGLEPMLTTFREILAQDADDGVEFDADALRVDRIREELEYSGLRLRNDGLDQRAPGSA
jgi:predicted nucleotidyltransferase component of viral defense system